MRFLFVYPNEEGYGRIPLGIALLMTILKKEGHDVDLFDVTFVIQNANKDTEMREEIGEVKVTDTGYLYHKHSYEEIDQLFVDKIQDVAPDIIGFGIVEDNYLYCHRLLKVGKNSFPHIDTIVGGSTPSIAPEVLIENPYIDYLMQGESENSLVEFCSLYESGEDVTTVNNLWYKKNGRVYNNPLGSLTSLDNLPILDYDHWEDAHLVKPYDGHLYRIGSVEMSRGCPQKCTYCINESLRNTFYETGSSLIRKKSVPKLIEEVRYLKNKYNLEMIFFCDDNFLAITRDRMDEFVRMWNEEIQLPYWINTTLESVTDWRLEAMKNTNCFGIGIGVESGNEWFRNAILKRNVKNGNNKLIEVFNLIKSYGIRTTANAMIGFPGETEADIFETIKLIKSIQPDSYDLAFVAPYIGTPLHLLAKDNHLIDTSKELGFMGMSKEITLRKGSVIKNPYVTNSKLEEIMYNFIGYVEGEIPIPSDFIKPAPGSIDSSQNREDSLEEAEYIDKLFIEIEEKKKLLRKSKQVN